MATTQVNIAELHDYYQQHGYALIQGLIPAEKIDALVARFESEIKPSHDKFYRQNTNVYDTNRLNSGGHIIQSFLDIHHYKRFPEFRKLALDIYFSDEILSGLTQVTGNQQHNLMQTMLFDANTATAPHQDWWYLDSVPNGQLLGAWIALQDIEEDAGRFYVIPGTQNMHLHKENMPHSEWLVLIKQYFDANQDKVFAPALKKGDVMFWNSGTIHGALPTKNPALSRRSLTAHFMPAGLTYGNLFTSKPWINYENYEGHPYFANQPEYSLKADLVSRLKVAVYDNPKLMKLARKFQKKSINEF
ncbi:MAG: phytanoyl-CoA dioxygenase family protein [Methylomonas sp.]|jgi:phytanoyl-CoA hydroxylase